MNFNPMNGTVNQNQLNYFINNGLLEGIADASSITVLPDWTDGVNFDILERGRAYMEINCAHCHQPGGIVPPGFLLDFRLETPFATTGIYEHRGQIESRIQSLVPTYMMPQIGRSVVHDEGVAMMLEYLQAIED
jgi:mono/diheme cytochrome c family protein